jgi:hypothetical protein
VQPTANKIKASGPVLNRAACALAVMLLAALAVALLAADVEILKRAMGATDSGNDLASFVEAVDSIKGPATLALMTIVPVGVIVGGGMMATGSRKGVQVMAASCGAGALVLLGNGLVA